MRRIAIVGGGPGGLFTAFLLGQRCAEMPEITIFEASERVGGKILTKRFDVAPVPYEAGAAELYQYGKDPLRLLIKEILGLPVVRMAGRAVVLDGHILASMDDVAIHYGKATVRALRQFDKLAHSVRDYRTFYDGSWTADNEHPWFGRSFESVLAEVPDHDARRYLKVMMHSDLAAEPDAMNALYGIDNYLINDPDYCKYYSIQGGMERLIDALRDSITARVELESPVERVEKAHDGESYRVSYRRGGVVLSDEFDAVAVALPMAWLPKLQWGGEPLTAAMTAHRTHYDHPAHYLRISLLFDEPFWRATIDESFFMLDSFGGCCVYDEGSRHDVGRYGVLAWLLGGADAVAAANLSDEELIEMALDSLPIALGSARAKFLEGHVHRWLGSVSARPGGIFIKGLEERQLPEPVGHPRLYLVGDYLFDTSINGVLDSADFVSEMMIDSLKIPRSIVENDYFDDYVDGKCYEDSYRETFDARHLVELIRTAWGATAPYRLLDAGSASGLTLRDLAKLGVDATGVESNPFIHAQTPKRWKPKNFLGDVRDLPFEDGAFDFVHETCLACVPEGDLVQALSELHRVARLGVILGSVVSDMKNEAIDKYKMMRGVQSFKSLEEWSGLLGRHGFQPATIDRKLATALWQARTRAFGGSSPYRSPHALGLRFHSRRDQASILSLPSSVSQTVVAEAAV
ncbi:MAG: methyltransferase protein [Planctomycetota bacterium]|nr:methyltransferase protein [Planctomycetota bacterium]